ncbi:MAG: undecaprenyl/decaprenyl-phosphate alpha-N-acetylglucosaminyl 1-phosphate transferase [Veillonella sp.]|nr:undecaprenyl/decaprenyl-phosphate alpha-N-acetylglucosaminyl 1-phosphate transferase [Veillonella sp.]MCF0155745.1 undecaprenyl/decaprenyl-phosphate alpha-N-acetylglucosaminyl 1-phosphate transferase [Veillonella sp.]
MLDYAVAFLVGLVITLAVTPLVSKLAVKIGAIDKPDARKVHHGAIPRLGGLAIFAGYIISLVYSFPHEQNHDLLGLVLGTIILVAVGIWDDVKQIEPKTKLMGQIIAAAVLCAYGIRVDFINLPWGGTLFLHYWSVPLTIFWIVGFTNIVNLIDGLDGLAAGISGIACLVVSIVLINMGQVALGCAALALAGSICGFLRYNFNPAKIFMGDTGSMLLGYTVAAISVMGAVKTAAVAALAVPAIVLGLPILDTLFAIVRRKISGRPIFKPDKGHVHHRLLAQGLSQKQAVLLMYGVTAFLGGIAVIVAEVNAWVGAAVVLVLFIISIFVARRLGVIARTDATAHPLDDKKD